MNAQRLKAAVVGAVLFYLVFTALGYALDHLTALGGFSQRVILPTTLVVGSFFYFAEKEEDVPG